MQRSTVVTRSFLLPLFELLNLDLRDIVRVENKNYLIRSYEFSLGTDGVGLTKCELVAVS